LIEELQIELKAGLNTSTDSGHVNVKKL